MIHRTSHNPDITVIQPGVERLTAVNAKAFKDEVIALISDGAAQLVIDFKDVSFLDSSGLGALVGILKKIGNRGDLAVSGLKPDVEQMFRICRMDRVFTVYGDVETAVQTMAESL
ncbi:putative anti-sigma-factor antagonist [Octadecabacter antarcticus 307]|uniref:Anti-sigma factor antagonist n=1 Tax=Octadecabacter antarcticus 307 TaxID=391626 RepID=M9R339_9RHOB|nr:STAS domain-containing protein [Octadecabacter antarcticus]AGI67019.1 putative anti-sigma-factor antagonist [Octadecabacter antarcticus 307]